MKRILLLVLVLLLAACQPQGSAADAAAAQRYLPNIIGYTASSADSIVSAITAAGAGGALTSGNVPLAAAISRADAVYQCLKNTGAVDARVYLESPAQGLVPEAGAVVVINQERFNQNLLGCVASGARAQSVQGVLPEICSDSGTFIQERVSYQYVYVGAGTRLCGFFSQHFSNLKGRS
ncbi:MAG: hypothetical protein NZ750_06345 [Anaerolineae bacterium]|nr:hypothetical protein [Anaerolineae bacterium]MDW8171703.1 hypothetical protein [Anaerolineae bacterium]